MNIKGNPDYVGEYLYRDAFSEDRLYVYRMNFDGAILPNPDEVAKVQFFSLRQIEEMLTSQEKFHPEFHFLWGQGVVK